MTTSTHTCLAPECEVQVPSSQLACRPHWYSIPKPIRDRVWAGYRRGAGGPEHDAAIREAIGFLNGRQAA